MADYSWMSESDWTDAVIERLRWKLDAAKKNPDLLSGYERNTIFQIIKAAKKHGNAYKLTGKHRTVVREILSPVEREVIE